MKVKKSKSTEVNVKQLNSIEINVWHLTLTEWMFSMNSIDIN